MWHRDDIADALLLAAFVLALTLTVLAEVHP